MCDMESEIRVSLQKDQVEQKNDILPRLRNLENFKLSENQSHPFTAVRILTPKTLKNIK